MKSFPRIHKPLVHYTWISFSAFVFLLISFILLLLVALSIPIIKTVWLLKLTATQNPNEPVTEIASVLKFGVWGVCASNSLDGFQECIGPQLGYTIPQDLVNYLKLPSAVVQVLVQAVIVVLIVHPIAAGLSFIAFINSLFLGSHAVSISALAVSLVTAMLSTVVFAVDLVIVLVAKSKVKDIGGVGHNLSITWGNAVWMMLVAVIFTWTAVLLLSARACYCCGVSRRDLDPYHSKLTI